MATTVNPPWAGWLAWDYTARPPVVVLPRKPLDGILQDAAGEPILDTAGAPLQEARLLRAVLRDTAGQPILDTAGDVIRVAP